MDLLLHLAKPLRGDVRITPLAGKHYAAITFDDAFQSVVANALPELKKRGIPSILFIVSGAVGLFPPWLSDQNNGCDSSERIMTAEQLRELPSDLVAIGSHTMTHPRLTSLCEEDAKREIAGSRKQLEGMLRRPVRLFSFPHGEFNESLVGWCREEGYDRVFTTLPTMAFSDSSEYVTGRVWADPTDWNLEFRLKVLGAYRWLPQAFVWKRKIRTVLAWVRTIPGA
jgi:peptidoglycan/xylan/chitin deacetylase (PgdA/CDA1 family)